MSEGGWANELMPWAWIGGAGMLGRLMYHAKMVQQGKRKPFSLALFLDIPIALGSGWAAFGIAKWYGIPWETQVSAAIIAAYFGPYGMDIIFAKWADRKEGTASD